MYIERRLFLLVLLGMWSGSWAVLAVRAPRLVRGPESRVVRKGDWVELHCDVRGQPKPTINWYFNSKLIVNSRRKSAEKDVTRVRVPHVHLSTSGARLRLQRVVSNKRRSNTGLYTCRAANAYGHVVSKHARIEIAYLEKRFKMQPPPHTTVRIGRPAFIPCLPPQGNPRPRVRWLFDGRPLEMDSTRYMLWGGSLGIDAAAPEHAGAYKCIAQNNAGRKGAPTNLIVL